MKKRNQWLIGIDEAGRGPLAGPITFAMIKCRKNIGRSLFRKVRDSKHLTPKAREEWFLKLKNHPKLFYSVTSIGPSIIDRDGLTQANARGIKRLLRRMAPRGEVLLDGGLKAPSSYRQKTIIKGDERVPIISAASIIAKVVRDRKMKRLASRFQHYGFEIHKGYGTKLHREYIKKYGLSKVHRRSFCKKIILT